MLRNALDLCCPRSTLIAFVVASSLVHTQPPCCYLPILQKEWRRPWFSHLFFHSLIFLHEVGYLWPYWSRAFRALCTPGTARMYHTRSERNSPSTAILVGCIVPALRSVCYKYTTTGNLWTLEEHTGSRSCSMLQKSRSRLRRLIVCMDAQREYNV